MRMPDTSSRISASSSTTRTSAAMSRLLQFRRGRPTRGWEIQSDTGPGQVRGVPQRQLAAVVFQDPFDDRETKAGALLASGDIGLGQPVAVALGQAHAVVLDDEVQ